MDRNIKSSKYLLETVNRATGNINYSSQVDIFGYERISYQRNIVFKSYYDIQYLRNEINKSYLYICNEPNVL